MFNTNQPSRNPFEQQYTVLHWVQIGNRSLAGAKSFTVNRYDGDGVFIVAKRVTIPSEGRRDVQGGHEDAIQARIGTIEIVADDPEAEFSAEVFRYGGNAPQFVFPTAYTFGISDNLADGSTKPQYVAVSRGASGEDYLELAELTPVAQDVRVEVFSNWGTKPLDKVVRLRARQQIHEDMRTVLRLGEAGYAKVTPLGGQPLLVKNTVYFHDAFGSVTDAYAAQGRTELISQTAFAIVNTFLQQRNWFKLFNFGSSPVTVRYTQHRIDGSTLGSVLIPIPAQSGTDVEVKESLGLDLGPDTYGVGELTSSSKNVLISDALRTRELADGTVDIGKSLAVR